MSDEDRESWVEVPIPERELQMPPDRFAVPGSALPQLETGTRVSFGEPGGWWVIDVGRVIGQPDAPGTPDEAYPIRLEVEEFIAQIIKPDVPRFDVAREVMVRTDRLWVYQDAPQTRQITDLVPWHPNLWFDQVLDDNLTPPPVRRPRPARELPSLTGQRVRQLGRTGEWLWLIAVSEPLRTSGDIVVRVVTERGWHWILAAEEPPKPQPFTVALNTLWAY